MNKPKLDNQLWIPWCFISDSGVIRYNTCDQFEYVAAAISSELIYKLMKVG